MTPDEAAAAAARARARAESLFRDTLDGDLRREALIGFVMLVVVFALGWWLGRRGRGKPAE